MQAPQWGVSLRKGNHQGLISFETMEKNIARLVAGVYAPTRKDCKEDFPLRGAVACASCGTALTAGWSKGKYKHYPYYFCRQRGCSEKGKSIARDKLEQKFRTHLSELEPPKPLIELASAMFRDCWEQQAAKATSAVKAFKADAVKVQKSIDQLLDRIVETSNPSVVQAYENKIEELERKRLLLLEKTENPARSKYTFDELFELSLKFLGNPCKLWDSGRLELRRIVLKLAFAGHLDYCRKTGSLNSKKSLPFRALEGISMGKMKMVLPERFELSASPLPRECSTPELRQHLARYRAGLRTYT